MIRIDVVARPNNRVVKRTLLAAGAAASLLLSLGGVAFAADDVAAPRLCSVVEQELLGAQAAAELPVTIGGAEFTSLPALQQFLTGLPDIPAAADSRAAAQAVLDAAANVELLKQERTTCTTAPEPTTTEPTPTEDPEPTETPAPSEEPVVDPVEQARVEIVGFTCDPTLGSSEALGRLSDRYFALVQGLPSETTSEQYGRLADAFSARVSELNYCFPQGVTPPADVTNAPLPSAGTGSGSNSGEFADSVPSGSIDTGAF